MATFSKHYIITVLLFFAGAPLLHQFLHNVDGPSESYGVSRTLPNEPRKYQQTQIKSPDASLPGSAGHTVIPAKFEATLEKSAPKDESTDTQKDIGLVLVEIGQPLRAEEPAQWTQEKYWQEIDIGRPRLTDAWTYDEVSALNQPISIEKDSLEHYSDVIEIGAGRDVNPYP